MRKDFASSVFAERSLRDRGLDGGLGGLSIVSDDSSADDRRILVLEEAALVFLSIRGELVVLFLRRFEPELPLPGRS